MAKVGIVCDSTCDMGPQWLAENDVVMVPLKVLFGEQTYLDWVDFTPETFFEKLKASPTLPKTSQPSPAEFTAVYQSLADAGCDEIVSIHLTSALSGTHESAILAAASSPIPVRVVDTLTVSAAVALAICAATAARDAGGDADVIEAAAWHVVNTDRLLFALDTLEYLVKGGRAGKAQGLAASLLNIKPVLTFNDEGIIEPFKKVKGTKKALAEMAAQVAEDSKHGRVRAAFLHSLSPNLVVDLQAALDEAGADYEVEGVHELGAVMGTYAGPGAVGVAYYPIG
ncbi:MAG: DegV family protein [Coriobacteriia bacterium]|nr:DegV family protein [Coriobacteriia bacterium]